jgi:hypothetical protein
MSERNFYIKPRIMVLKEESTKWIYLFKIWWIWELLTAQSWMKLQLWIYQNFVILSLRSWNEIIIQINDQVYVQFVGDMIFHIYYAA